MKAKLVFIVEVVIGQALLCLNLLERFWSFFHLGISPAPLPLIRSVERYCYLASYIRLGTVRKTIVVNIYENAHKVSQATHTALVAHFFMMISFVVALIALVVVSAMAVEMTDHQLAFYLRGAQEQHFINEVCSVVCC